MNRKFCNTQHPIDVKYQSCRFLSKSREFFCDEWTLFENQELHWSLYLQIQFFLCRAMFDRLLVLKLGACQETVGRSFSILFFSILEGCFYSRNLVILFDFAKIIMISKFVSHNLCLLECNLKSHCFALLGNSVLLWYNQAFWGLDLETGYAGTLNTTPASILKSDFLH